MQSAEKSNTFDLSSWLESAGDRRGVRISVRENGEWIDRNDVVRTGDEAYRPDTDGTVRYYLRAEDGGRVEKWTRYAFTETGSEFVSGTPDDATEIVLEVRDSVVDGTPPWERHDLVTFSPVVLAQEGTDEFQPVNANRVAGLEEEKERLNRFLDMGHVAWGLTEERGILLEGPPGTGKTELVMEACLERYGSLPVMISGPEFLSKWVGESEKVLRKKFDEARATDHKVLYIDEIDAITRDRSEMLEDYSARIVSQLLVLLDGVEAKQENEESDRSLKVIASTNIPRIVDDALKRPGRLGDRPVRFDRPNKITRKAILHHYLERIYTSKQGKLGSRLRAFVVGDDLQVLNGLVDETEGFTGANLEDLVQEAVSSVRERDLDELDLATLEQAYEDNFSSSDGLVTTELTEADLTAQEGIDVPLESIIAELNDDPTGSDHSALDVSKTYFAELLAQSDPEFKCTLREISPKAILDDDLQRTKTNVIEAFDHSENERVCLYLRDVERLVHAREYSSLVDDIIGVLNEQLLQWEDGNLLVIDSMSESERRQLTNIEPFEVQ